MTVPNNDPKSKRSSVPSEIRIIAGIEGFSGLVYLVNFLALLSVTFSPTLMLLSFLSFTIAYGIWSIKKWAWFLSLILSIFGVVTGILVLAFTGISESSIFGRAPMIIIDFILILMLLSKDVRNTFKIY
ncbi:MAG: hypothetical protein QXU33_00510 [Candidatus Methanomethyliaceae archaeon]